jgi:hypothetical protein
MLDPNAPKLSYRTLDALKIVATIGNLRLRIIERFPHAGLASVCGELEQIAGESWARVELIQKRNWVLRLVVGVVVGLAVFALLKILPFVDFTKTTADNVYTVLQGVEATMNILVLIGAAMLFLFTVEERMKRKRALKALHELRSIIHVIDMHQLTKDPSAVIGALAPTEHSPKRTLTTSELIRYLDYCSEMLSLTSKVAALYAQSLPDPVVTDAVSDIERLTTNLSQKVWQKIMILENEQNALAKATAPTLAPPTSLPQPPKP